MLNSMDSSKRFVPNGQGQVMDRDMHPKVKKAQEAYARRMAERKEQREREQRH